ncbi:MAG TPA: iron ABC transporter permease [Alphaproteobacteria bacterium]|nr:iron ABC transporter permease [Alphaproteobacteria bacterium]
MTALSWNDAPAPALRRRFNGWSVATAVLALLIVLPLATVMGFAAAPQTEIWGHLASTVLGRYVLNSLGLMVGVGLGTLVVGTGTAWLVTMCRFPGRRVLEWALLLPLAMPAYVVAYTYAGVLDYAGPVQGAIRALFGFTSARDYWFPHFRSLGGAVAVLTAVLYPYVYLLARTAFLGQCACVLEASRTLGQSPWQGFSRVALPLARPALAVGVALALMEVLGDFGAVQHLAVDTFTTGLTRVWLGMGDAPAAAQLAVALLGFIGLLVALERLSRRRQRFHHATNRYRTLSGYRLSPLRGLLAMLACALPVLLGFVLPAGILGAWAVETAPQMVDGRFWLAAGNSLAVAGIAAAAATLVAVILAYGLRLRPNRMVRATVRLAGIGYAVPGPVIALGVMLAFTAIDGWVDGAMTAAFGISTGLLLSGTAFAVIFAYVVRFLALSLGTVESGLIRVKPHMDDAARSLGHGPGSMLRRVHAPIIKGSVLTAALLVFVDVMKELPATLMLRPFGFDTLAVRAYQLASDERLRDCAPAALAIVLVGLVPVLVLSAGIARARPGQGR